MPSVFLSYSRADRDFVIQVRDALARAKREVWVDLEDIPPSAEWEREINAGSEVSDAFVCVLSPEWAASEVCQIELNNAVAEHKRVIPLVHRDVPPERLAPTVRALNWIPFRETDNLNAAFEQLIFALDTDLDYWHLASRLLVRAGEWEHTQANASFLLRGKELAEAEQWLAEGAEKQPSPTALQMRYITASRRGAVRRQRALIGGLSVFLAIAVTLAALASIQTVRVSQSNDQLRISNNRLCARALAGASSAALVNDHVDQALLLSVAATEQQDTEQTRNALLDALEFTPHRATTVANPFQMAGKSGAAAVGYSADGKTLMYAFEGDQGRIGLWNTATQRVRAQYSVGDTVYKAALSPDGTRLATLGLDHGLVLREAESGHPVATLAPTETLDPNNQQPITQNIALGGVGVAFSPRGDKLAAILCDTATCSHPYIGLWDGRTGVAAGRLALRFQPLLTTFAFSPDGSRLAATECDVFSGSGPCELAAWNLAAGNAHLYRHAISAVAGAPFGVPAAAVTAGGQTLYTAGGASPPRDERGRLIAWDPATGARVAGSPPLISPSGAIAKLAFSPDGHTFVTADATKNLYLWDLGSRAPIGGPIAGHESEVQSVAFAPDGTEFATGSDDGKVLLWRLRPYSPFSLPPGRDFDGTSQAAFSPDGRLLATANCDGAVRLWDAQSAHVTKRLSVEGASGFCLRTLAFSPDGRQLAAEAYNGVTPIWDVASGNLTSFCTCGDLRGGLQA